MLHQLACTHAWGPGWWAPGRVHTPVGLHATLYGGQVSSLNWLYRQSLGRPRSKLCGNRGQDENLLATDTCEGMLYARTPISELNRGPAAEPNTWEGKWLYCDAIPPLWTGRLAPDPVAPTSQDQAAEKMLCIVTAHGLTSSLLLAWPV